MSSRTILGICIALAAVGCFAVYGLFQTNDDNIQQIGGQNVQYTSPSPATSQPTYAI